MRFLKMSRKKENTTGNNENVVVTTDSRPTGFNSFFDRDIMLENYATTTTTNDGIEVIKYAMELDIISGENAGAKMTVTDSNAIEAIQGLRNVQTMEKWLSYKQGVYLMQLADSDFMKDNNITSVKKLSEIVELGVQTSTANALESIARKLQATFDENGNLHLVDNLPILSFWAYNEIITLVTETDNGYDLTVLKDFIEVANVTPLMTQKKIREKLKEYKQGKLNNKVALPDKISKAVEKQAETKKANDDKKAKNEKMLANTSDYLAEKSANMTEQEKKVLACDLISKLSELTQEFGIDFDYGYLIEAFTKE